MRITKEDLIAAEARKHYLQAGFASRAGHKPGVDAVGGRLVHRIEKLRDRVLEIGGGHADLLVFGAEGVREIARDGSFAEFLLVENDGQGADWSGTAAGCETRDTSRIDAAAEEDANWDVGDEMPRDGI